MIHFQPQVRTEHESFSGPPRTPDEVNERYTGRIVSPSLAHQLISDVNYLVDECAARQAYTPEVLMAIGMMMCIRGQISHMTGIDMHLEPIRSTKWWAERDRIMKDRNLTRADMDVEMQRLHKHSGY